MTREDTRSRIIKNWDTYCLRRQSQYNKICGKTQSTNLRMLAITFNMVQSKSRPQTQQNVLFLSTLYVPLFITSDYGNESYSGKKIPWTEMSVSVRFRPELQIAKQGNGKPVQFSLEECEYVRNCGLRKWSCRSFLGDNVH